MSASKDWFPGETYSYATNLHANEVIIWNDILKGLTIDNYSTLLKIRLCP